MKILITGGTGFQGSNLSKSLLNDGHDVVILNLHSEIQSQIKITVISEEDK